MVKKCLNKTFDTLDDIEKNNDADEKNDGIYDKNIDGKDKRHNSVDPNMKNTLKLDLRFVHDK